MNSKINGENKKAIITSYFKKQFGCLLAALVALMLAILSLVAKQFLISNLGESAVAVITIILFGLSALFFALTAISNIKMRIYFKSIGDSGEDK